MTRSKQVGTAAETAVVTFMRRWFPQAERSALHGVNDVGDITGIPNTCVEVKAVVRGGYDIPGWMRETEKERNNRHVDRSLLVIKPVGVATAEKFWAVMPFTQACHLLRADLMADFAEAA